MLPGIKQFDLRGKVALVTGGTKGLGRAMAEGLASAGADVAIVSRHGDEAAAVAQQIERRLRTPRRGARSRRGRRSYRCKPWWIASRPSFRAWTS